MNFLGSVTRTVKITGVAEMYIMPRRSTSTGAGSDPTSMLLNPEVLVTIDEKKLLKFLKPGGNEAKRGAFQDSSIIATNFPPLKAIRMSRSQSVCLGRKRWAKHLLGW